MTTPTRTWRVLNLEMRVDEPEAVLRDRAAAAIGIDPEHVRGLRIARRSVDARRRGKTRRVRFVVQADLVIDATHHGASFEAAVRAGRAVETRPDGSFPPRVAEVVSWWSVPGRPVCMPRWFWVSMVSPSM